MLLLADKLTVLYPLRDSLPLVLQLLNLLFDRVVILLAVIYEEVDYAQLFLEYDSHIIFLFFRLVVIVNISCVLALRVRIISLNNVLKQGNRSENGLFFDKVFQCFQQIWHSHHFTEAFAEY